MSFDTYSNLRNNILRETSGTAYHRRQKVIPSEMCDQIVSLVLYPRNSLDSEFYQVRGFHSFVSLDLLISIRWNGQLESVLLEILDVQKWKLCVL
jgi:hypothetical protein